MYVWTYSQSPIFVTISGGDLYKLNLSACTSTFVGSTGQGFGDIAFTPNGKLWGIVSGDLYQIDTTTANSNLIGFTGLQSISLVGLNDTTVLAEVNQNLYGIRTTNTTTYSIGSIGYSATGDLTWYDNNLYMTSGSELIKITLDATNSSILNAVPVSTINAILGCEGAATSSFSGSDNRIIGFSNTDVIKICQIDGTYQMLCSNIVPGGIPGGASIRLATQNPIPTSCQDFVGINDLTKQGRQLIISPNPFSYETKIEVSKILTNACLIVTNSFGQVIKQIDNINGQSIKFRCDNCESGIYFLQIKENSKTIFIDKLVIENN